MMKNSEPMKPNKPSQIDIAVQTQARDWLVLLNSGDVSEEQREAFGRWMAASDAHERAFADYEKTWQQLARVESSTRAALRASVADMPAAGWRALLSQCLQWLAGRSWHAAAFASILLFGVWAMMYGRNLATPEISYYQTAVAQVQTINLPDGSQLTLAGKTRIKSWQTTGERHVELLSGQAFFDIAKNPQKPFYVSAGGTRIRVVGTRFDVNRFNGQVRVNVEEGIVSVSALDADSSTQALLLNAGNTVTQLADGVFSAVGDIDPAAAAPWRSGRLVYNNVALVDVISEVNRYYDGEILVHDKLKNERITMALTMAEVNQLPVVLAQILPARLQQVSEKRLYLFPAH